MCTLIVARNVYKDFPLVVAANRDEVLDRSSEPPRVRESVPKILCPMDLRRGGTWIGVNEHGMFVGLTNRHDVESRWGRMGRGEIVSRALSHQSALDAFYEFRTLEGEKMNGFYLVIADRSQMFLMKADGTHIERSVEGWGLLVVTNDGIGRDYCADDSVRVNHVLRVWKEREIAHHEPTIENLKPLLEIHDKDLLGTCINLPDENYGTLSSSIIRLKKGMEGDEWQYFHRERLNPETHVCSRDFDMRFNLKINP